MWLRLFWAKEGLARNSHRGTEPIRELFQFGRCGEDPKSRQKMKTPQEAAFRLLTKYQDRLSFSTGALFNL
jgi:hypothetical protein